MPRILIDTGDLRSLADTYRTLSRSVGEVQQSLRREWYRTSLNTGHDPAVRGARLLFRQRRLEGDLARLIDALGDDERAIRATAERAEAVERRGRFRTSLWGSLSSFAAGAWAGMVSTVAPALEQGLRLLRGDHAEPPEDDRRPRSADGQRGRGVGRSTASLVTLRIGLIGAGALAPQNAGAALSAPSRATTARVMAVSAHAWEAALSRVSDTLTGVSRWLRESLAEKTPPPTRARNEVGRADSSDSHAPLEPAYLAFSPGGSNGSLEPRPTVQQYQQWLAGKGGDPEYQYQCTSWIVFRRQQLNEQFGKGLSVPTNDGLRPSAGGGAMGTDPNGMPTLGAIVSYGAGVPSDWGHAMIVEEIFPDGFRVSEMNINGRVRAVADDFRDNEVWRRNPDGTWSSTLDGKVWNTSKTLKFTP